MMKPAALSVLNVCKGKTACLSGRANYNLSVIKSTVSSVKESMCIKRPNWEARC
jgi:hypothetical protein